jgi:DNA polymerase-3 subunit alpha
MSVLSSYQSTFEAPVEENFDFMKRMAIKGLKCKGVYEDKWYQDQLDMELEVIKECGLEDFFLQTAYICALIDDADIFRGPARGSCLASVVCYGLNITKLPPKEYNLSFARFLNKTRALTQLPDIDTDVSSDARDDVLKLIKKTFGEDRCGQVLTKIPFSAKMLIKDLSARQGIDFQTVNLITRQLDPDEDYHDNAKVMEFLYQHPEVKDYIDPLMGITKSLGVHAGALIVFDDVMDKYVSTVSISDNEIISNNGSECEAMGFLKNDTLGIEVLDVQRDCLRLIDEDVSLPYDFTDPEVYKTICKNPMGLFQLEKGAGRAGVAMVQPENFSELTAIISLIRPGARNSGMDKLYCDYKFGRKEPEYLDERLKETLKDTQGLMIFQEDAMAVARDLAGMSDLETDQLRRAISKKKKEAFTEFKPKFLQGCKKNNVDDEVAEKLWNDMEKSSDYSFNRSHAVGYSVLAYQSAWLKTYYPLEFAVSMLKHSSSDEKIIEVLHMIKDSNAQLLSPDINRSEADTTINGNEIVIGFNLIDKVSDKVSEAIIKERKRGEFKSFDDFCARVPPRKCNKRVKENLISAGAFDNIPIVHKEEDKQSRLI